MGFRVLRGPGQFTSDTSGSGLKTTGSLLSLLLHKASKEGVDFSEGRVCYLSFYFLIFFCLVLRVIGKNIWMTSL